MRALRLALVALFFATVAHAQVNMAPLGPLAGSSGGGGGAPGSSSMQVFNVTGAAGNGTTDDQGPINTALTACGAAGGGWVVLSNGRYLVDTVGLTVPSRCIVYCPVPLLGNANPTNYSSVPYGVILNSAQTITMSKNSGWQGCPVLQKAMVNSSAWADYPSLTQRDTLNLVATFAGNGFTFSANDVQIRDTFIGGFTLAVNGNTSGTARLQMDHVNIDATKCLLLDNSHDISRLTHVECFPFMTSGFTNAQTSFNISNIANNGSGLYRVTLGTTSAIPVTGDTVWISQTVVGPQSVQARKWVITVIDTTHFDLQSSPGTGSFTTTGNTSNLSTTVCGLLSTASIGVGQGITGTGIPGSTTVTFISPNGGCLGLSNAATATNSGTTLTFADTAYSSGGTANLDASFRTGIGMEFTNSEGIIGQDLFSFGHSNGYHAGTGMTWLSCSGCWTDGPFNNDVTIVSLLIDSTAKGTTWAGGRLNNTAIQVNSSSAFAAGTFTGINMDSTASNWMPVIEMDQGIATFTGNTSSNGNGFYVIQDAISSATFVGNSLEGRFAFQTITGPAKVNAIANNTLTTSYAGTVNGKNQQWILGGGGANCANGQGANCSIQMGGPQVDLASGVTAMVNSGSATFSGNQHLLVLTAGAGITTYTINLPGIATAGQWLRIYIQQTITGLTMGGTTSTGMPTNPTAGWYDCFSTSTSAYVCGSG